MSNNNNITSVPLKKQIKDLEESRLRAAADLQNFQRRQSEQQAQWSSISVAKFVEKIIPNFLELQLGINHSEDQNVKKVVEKLFKNLENQGLKKIAPESGDDIDPDKHEVLMAEEGEAGKVVKVLEPGWIYQEKVITPAKISGAIA